MISRDRRNAGFWRIAFPLTNAGVLGSALLVVGCDADVHLAERSHVWGKVSYHGEPVRNGTVVFMPEGDKTQTWGAGYLRKDGTFDVQPSRMDVPLQAGRYQVYFRTLETAPSGVPPKALPIPEKFQDPETPVISVDINAEPMQVEITLAD